MNKFHLLFFLLVATMPTALFGMDSGTVYDLAEKILISLEKRFANLMTENTTEYGKKIEFIKTPVFVVEEKHKTTETQTHEVVKSALQELKNNGMTCGDITRCLILVNNQKKQRIVQNILTKTYPELMQKKPLFAYTKKMPVEGITIAITINAQKRNKKAKINGKAKL